jgi:hypothetical protein
MAEIGTNMAVRDAMRDMVITVHVSNPIHHRAGFWLGLRLMRLAAWLMGVGGVQVQGEPLPERFRDMVENDD